jgi:selenocysteine lyase/cysteine desulfurase
MKIRASERLGRLRFSFHLYNTAVEVEAVIAAIAQWPQRSALASLHL